MKFTLVNPPITLTNPKRLPKIQPPLGMAYLAGCLREAGHAVCVVDAIGEALGRHSPFRDGYYLHGLPIDEILDRIDPDSEVIGVGIMFSSFWPLSRVLIERIRERFPRAVIICGGEHVTALTQFVMEQAPVDYAIVGEAEETVVELAAHLVAIPGSAPIEGIAGLAYRAADGTPVLNAKRKRRRNLDEIPWPAWDLFPLENYLDSHLLFCMPLRSDQRPMIILATRGCPYTCTFCSNEQMWGINYFMRSPKDVVDEMEFYMRRYGATDFHFQDLTPIINARWAYELCQEIIDRKLNITWKTAAGTRSEALELELVKKMRESGCDELIMAPESGSEDILRVTRKRVKLEKVLTVARWIRDHRIPMRVTAFMIVGFPEERLRDVFRTYRYLMQMARAGFSMVYVARFTAYPGCEYHDVAVKEGRIVHTDDYFLNLERSFGLLNFRQSRIAWHPRWSARFILLLTTIAYLTFFASYYVLHPIEAAQASWNVLRNKPASRFERLFAYLLWQPLTRRTRGSRLGSAAT
jgi:anaerobic magnesium-protoporphyrin IX monomethyl ester cyclase